MAGATARSWRPCRSCRPGAPAAASAAHSECTGPTTGGVVPAAVAGHRQSGIRNQAGAGLGRGAGKATAAGRRRVCVELAGVHRAGGLAYKQHTRHRHTPDRTFNHTALRPKPRHLREPAACPRSPTRMRGDWSVSGDPGRRSGRTVAGHSSVPPTGQRKLAGDCDAQTEGPQPTADVTSDFPRPRQAVRERPRLLWPSMRATGPSRDTGAQTRTQGASSSPAHGTWLGGPGAPTHIPPAGSCKSSSRQLTSFKNAIRAARFGSPPMTTSVPRSTASHTRFATATASASSDGE